MNLEHELHRALARKDPPDDFAQKVLSRLPGTSGGGKRSGVWRRKWLALPLAASLFAAVGWGYYRDNQIRREAEAERAAYEATLALQITGEKLLAIQKKLQGVEP